MFPRGLETGRHSWVRAEGIAGHKIRSLLNARAEMVRRQEWRRKDAGKRNKLVSDIDSIITMWFNQVGTVAMPLDAALEICFDKALMEFERMDKQTWWLSGLRDARIKLLRGTLMHRWLQQVGARPIGSSTGIHNIRKRTISHMSKHLQSSISSIKTERRTKAYHNETAN